jgi:hypothetical protein
MTGRDPVGRRGAISVKMTAQEFISRAVNTVENRLDEVEQSGEETPLDGVRYGVGVSCAGDARYAAAPAMMRPMFSSDMNSGSGSEPVIAE